MKSRVVLPSIALSALALALALALTAVPTVAHHGWDANEKNQFELSGTVEKPVSLAGPHATMQIRAEGKLWDITLAPPARTERAGLKPDVIPVGAQVTVSGHRNSDKNKLEVKGERVTYNGKVYNVYPDRE
jgi:hypothetical protein